MEEFGMMPMPADFRYRDVYEKGKPRHDRDDPFLFRHPPMPAGKRAKIFAPFDALRGFDFAIMCKNELYTDKVTLSPEDAEEKNWTGGSASSATLPSTDGWPGQTGCR